MASLPSSDSGRRVLATEAREQGTAVACVTHDEESIATADHVVRLEGGHRVA